MSEFTTLGKSHDPQPEGGVGAEYEAPGAVRSALGTSSCELASLGEFSHAIEPIATEGAARFSD